MQCSARVTGTSSWRRGLAPLVSVIMIGCGGATVDLHAAFASIEIDEARIEHASIALDEHHALEAREEICAASTHLCATATPLADPDATTRCERARERCARATASAP
jgi:hypothetical protein